MKQKLIAYCGLDCRKCDAYIATINKDDTLKQKTANLWTKMNNTTITPEMINCMGCRMDGVKTPFCANLCEIRQCALKKSLETCGDCDEMKTCKIIGKILNNSKEARENLTN